MAKEIKDYSSVERQILEAVSAIADPVIQTLSPKGGNVMFTDAAGHSVVSNDGISIAREITLGDSFKDMIISTIRETSLRTNREAGDGTTTGILLTSTLVREGIRMRNDGHNPMDISRVLRESASKIVARLEAQKQNVIDDNDKFNIAYISANNDGELATKVVEAINIVGTDGMVFIEPNSKPEDEIKGEVGFVINDGMFRPELRTHGFAASYEDVPVLVTDKRLYYKEEAETILNAVYKAGKKEVVIVARDFIGECLPMLLAQHTRGAFKILLVKDSTASESSTDTLNDLATYLGTKVIRDAEGSIVNRLDISQFGTAKRVFSDSTKTVLGAETDGNTELTELIDTLRKRKDDGEDEETIEKRIASLTTGMVTIKVGGATETQVHEKIYRYEDAVNAVRTAMKHGYLPGGGVALMNAYSDHDHDQEYRQLFKRMCFASVSQIARNCGKDVNYVIDSILAFQEDENDLHIGYNAMSDTYENMLNVGIIDPFLVTKLAVENSLSAAANILSINYYIVNKEEKDGTKNNN